MTKYIITSVFTILFFLCEFFAHTNSQEKVPTAEEVLNKVSVVDLKSLNVSGGPDLNNLDSSAVNTALEEAKNLFKEKCDKNGGPGAFENAKAARDNLELCLKSFVNMTKLEKEMEKYKPTGDLDIVFKNYCRKTPTLKKCVSNFTTAIEPCLEAEEKENKKIIQNITDSLLNFVCYKEGDRIALFISADGPECLQSKQQEIQHCINTTFGSYMPQMDSNTGSLPGLGSLPSLVFGTKECTDISRLQICVVKELEQCSDPTPANIVDSIFNFIRKVTPCQNLISDKSSASTSIISLLAMISITLPLLRFV